MKNYSSNQRMLFIVGRGRSGTTLLSRILNMHSQIVVAPESMFIMSLHKKYSSIKYWREKDINSFYEDLWLDDRLVSWSLDRIFVKENLIKAFHEGVNNYPELCQIIYQTCAISKGKAQALVLGDKNPHYSLFVNELRNLYPYAKFLHILRDYRANIFSYQRVDFDSKDTTILAHRWKQYNQSILNCNSLNHDRILRIRFEDILTDFVKTFTSICNFVGVEYEDQMAEFYNQRQSSVSWHVNLNKNIQLDRINEWREALTHKDIAIADAICGDLAEQFDYIPINSVSSGYLSLVNQVKIFYASLMTMMERMLFAMPLWFNTLIIKQYRIITGSYGKKTD